MKLSLYKIEKEYIDLATSIIDNDGEVSLEQEVALSINKDQMQAKGICYGYIVKQLSSDVDQIEIEMKRLAAMKASRNKTIDRLKDTLSEAMELYGIDKLESPTLKISFRNSESVEVEDISLLDENYITTKMTKTADKKAIKESLNEGITVTGAVIVNKKNIQIK